MSADTAGALPVEGLLTEQEWAIVCAIRCADDEKPDGEWSARFYEWAEGTVEITWVPVPQECQCTENRLYGTCGH